jgi:hypothetical protein
MSLTDITVEDVIGQEAISIVGDTQLNPIDYWRKEGNWPKEYFEKDSNISHLLTRKKLSFSLCRKSLQPGSITPSSTMPSSTTPSD